MNYRKFPTHAALAMSLAVGPTAALAAGHGDHPATHANHGTPAAETKGHAHGACELHGGQVSMTKKHHFETVFGDDGIRVYRYSGQQTQELVGEATGVVTLRFKDGKSRTVPLVARTGAAAAGDAYFCTMHPDQVSRQAGACPVCNMKLVPQDYFFAAIDLRKVESGTLKASVSIQGLGQDEPEVTFVESYQGTGDHAMH